MKPIISFDLDGTLMTSTYADQVWLEGLPKIYAEEKNISFTQAKKILTSAYDRLGDHTPEWYDLSYWFTRYQLTTPWETLLDAYKQYIKPYPEVPDILKKLSQTYHLIIISNAKQEFIDIELTYSHLQTYFTHVFSSLSDFNQVKKHPVVYQQICNALNISPQDLIHVGDHKEYDFHSPRTINIQAYFLNRSAPQSTSPYTFSNLTEFYHHFISKKK